MRLGEWIRAATAGLAGAGLDVPALEARRLAEAVLELTPTALVLAAERVLTEAEGARLARLVEERGRRVPLQYLVGRAAFRRLDLAVGPGVFIPRPETEGLVELVLPRLHALARQAAPRILELCVGSGAILAVLLSECPPARGTGVELSPEAAAFAARNLAAAGVAERALLLHGDLYAPLAEAGVAGPFDLLIANPPYIPTAALAGLPPDVRLFEPPAALDGGPDGTRVIERILAGALAWLAPGAGLALEIDESHGPRVLELMKLHSIRDARLANDATGRPRYALGAI